MREPGFDVVVPSYQRPLALARCLDGLSRQELAAAKVIVVARHDDHATWDTAERARQLPITVVGVTTPGLVAALAAGVAATSAPRVAFTDDDAVPHAGWLAALAERLDEPGVGAAGGRDLMPGELEPRRHTVGMLTCYGRYVGNHHLGWGPARDVHVLKGVNMAYRCDALAIPRSGVVLGHGTQIHTEELMCAWARARGWRVVYDPQITVDHRTASDEALDGRAPLERDELRSAWFDGAHNRMLGTIATDPGRAGAHLAFGMLVGCREAPGLARTAFAIACRQREVTERFGPSLAGQWRAAGSARALATAMQTCDALRRGTRPACA